MKQEESFTKQRNKIIKRVVLSRIYIVMFLLVVKVFFGIWLWRQMKEYFFYSYGLNTLLTFLVYIVIVNRKGNPSYKLTWMLPILLLPIFGILLYLFFEYQRFPALLNKMQETQQKEMGIYMKQEYDVLEEIRTVSPESANLSVYLYQSMRLPAYRNTRITYYPSGEEFFPVLLEQLKKAQFFIFMEYFSFGEGLMWNSILEILKQKVKQGVEVRFLYDGTCSFNNPYNYAKTMEEYGIQCRVFNQIKPVLSTVQNNRDHRKITVIDGETAFTGGINLKDAYINAEVKYGYWKDTVIRLHGDAVRSFTFMFLQVWHLYDNNIHIEYKRYFPKAIKVDKNVDGFVIPYCDTPLDSDNTGESVYLDLLYNAKQYVHIMTPYLILDHEMLTALKFAAERGIDVRIMMPGVPDKSSAFAVAKTYYPELLQAGVKIYQFSPGFLHAKSFVVDG